MCIRDRSCKQESKSTPADVLPASKAGEQKAPPVNSKPPSGPTGNLNGVVRFTGEIPEMPAIQSGSDPECAKFEQKAETVLVTKERTLRDVVVRIPPGAAPSWVPQKKIRVDQKGCMYRPRVQTAVEGQSIEFANDDKTSHNVHAKFMPLSSRQGTESIVNRGQPAGSPPFNLEVHHSSNVYTLRCDQHAWMRGYVVLSDNPYAAVTTESAETTIANVPVGSYKLQAWHAFYGVKEIEVEVLEGKTTNFEFTYDAATDKPGA